MKSNKIFKLMCEYVKPRFSGLLESNPVEFEVRLSNTTKSIKNVLGHEVEKSELNKMIAEFNKKVREAYAKSRNNREQEDSGLIVVPDSIRKAAFSALEQHDLSPHFGSKEGVSMARILSMFPYVTSGVVDEISNHLDSCQYGDSATEKWTEKLWGGRDARAWVSSTGNIVAEKNKAEDTEKINEEAEVPSEDPTVAEIIIGMFREAHTIEQNKIDDRSISERKREAYMKNSGFI
jgi:hypothetical protein